MTTAQAPHAGVIAALDEMEILPPTGETEHPVDRIIYCFGDGFADGSGRMVTELGGKGAGLAEMTNLGIPVPAGFTIACGACDEYLTSGAMPASVFDGLVPALRRIERSTGRTLGDATNPLLVSVRSGAAVSMPGMLETVLNLGLNDRTVVGLAAVSGSERFALDAYRRFLQMYGSTVMNVPAALFDEAMARERARHQVVGDADLPEGALADTVTAFKRVVREATGTDVPSDPMEQLYGAIEAVWRSWTLRKAVDYRRVHSIPDTPGTAVSIVAMVFGNLDDKSGTGVAFTRNPSTGEPGLFGEFLSRAQGEDVVAGIRTPQPISELKRRMPTVFTTLIRLQSLLERHYRDMQDIEFTVERGRLYMLQTRSGKRSPAAAVRIATDMVNEGLIAREDAILRVEPRNLESLLHTVIDGATKDKPFCVGLPASPGAGAGIAVFDPDTADQRAAAGEPVVLVRDETTPEDFHGIVAARAIVTARGGMTSHAAVVARGMGKCAVVGCRDIVVDVDSRRLTAGAATITEGDWLTVDGTTGRVFAGNLPTVPSDVMRVLTGVASRDEVPSFRQYDDLLAWADEVSMLRVRANADTPEDARIARRAGAKGIGLCRTEHMFFGGDRISAMREMIVARDADERREALAKLLPMQRGDFIGIFRAMDGLPVTIRLLDPPLHEFLPREGADLVWLAKHLNIPASDLERRVEGMRETNPMLGHRGCRLGITYPEITAMQARAICEAALEVARNGGDVRPEIMVPLVATAKEFEHQRAIILEVANDVLGPLRASVPIQVGAMIELPRACVTAREIAATADFFSFGTNDLTQTTLGVSRDDAGRFLPSYVEQGLLPADPFAQIDRDGVGVLVGMATHQARAVRPSIKIGVCGEHGGDPESVHFFHGVGLDYVSCSPFRVPIARLAAAQAAMR
jgi:pyruvate,orthophosphate dikinase